MKINNPFERKEKRDFVPLSLFPASKSTKTSLQIGRATPVYCLDMMQGNKVKLSVDQLTRFASLSKPLMNKFEVNFGAYFVPYRALDDFFTSYYMTDRLSEIAQDVPSAVKQILHADQFFDASRPDSTRVHPIMATKNVLRNTKLVGGLADHLGYRTYESRLMKLSYPDYAGDGHPITWYFNNSLMQGQIAESFAHYKETYNVNIMRDYIPCYDSDLSGETMAFTSFVPWFLYNYGENDSYELKNAQNVTKYTIRKSLNLPSSLPSDIVKVVVTSKDAARLYMLGIDFMPSSTPVVTFPDGYTTLEGNTIDNILGRWYNYEVTQANTLPYEAQDQGLTNIPTANVIRYLSYMRIYSDWFLPENFCKADDFRDIVGNAYMKYVCESGDDVYLSLYNLYDDANAMWNVHTLNSYKFFQKYLQRGECLPVLWDKNYLNSMRSDLSLNGENRTDFKYRGNGVADTPVGSTIREHYFNRMFQRFKDLVARLGYDSRKNMAAIYGFKEDDKSLRSSISLGTHTFGVQIADIAQTSESTDTGSLGQFAGYAVSRSNGGSWEWTAGTHGVLMVLCYIRPKGVSYLNQCDRSIFKKDYYDYLLPQFGGVGYQDVDGQEISSDLAGRKIGSTEIYYEYMMMNNECSGLMRTSALDYHCDRDLDSIDLVDGNNIAPLFITPEDHINRIFNDTNEDNDPILAMMQFNGSVTRQLPEHIELDF